MRRLHSSRAGNANWQNVFYEVRINRKSLCLFLLIFCIFGVPRAVWMQVTRRYLGKPYALLKLLAKVINPQFPYCYQIENLYLIFHGRERTTFSWISDCQCILVITTIISFDMVTVWELWANYFGKQLR